MDIGKNGDSDSDATFCDLDCDMVLDSNKANESNVIGFGEFFSDSNIFEDFQAEAHLTLHETEQLYAYDNNSGTVEKLEVAPLCENENNSHNFSVGIQHGQMQAKCDINSDSDYEDVFTEKIVNIKKHGKINDQRLNDGDMDTDDSDITGSKGDPEVDAMERTFSLYMKIEYTDKLSRNSPMEQRETIQVVKMGQTKCSNAETVCTDDRESSMDREYECKSLVETEQYLAPTIGKPCNNHITKDINYPALHNNQLPLDDQGERQKKFNETGGRLPFKSDGAVEEDLSSLPHDSLPLNSDKRSIEQEGKRNKDRTNEMDDSLRFQHDQSTLQKKNEVTLQCSEPIARESQQDFDAEGMMATVQSNQHFIVTTISEPYAEKTMKKHFLQNEQITVKSNTDTFRKILQRKQQTPHHKTQSLTPLKDHASVQQSVTKNEPSFSWTIQKRANNVSNDCNQQFQGKSMRKTKKVVKGTKCVKRLKCDSDSDIDSPSSVDENCRRSNTKEVRRVMLTNSKKGLSKLELQQVNKHYSELQEMKEKVSGWLKGWGEPLSRETALCYLDDATRIAQHSNRLIRTDKENFRLQEVLQISESLELILDVAIKDCDRLQLIEEQELAGLTTEEDKDILESGEPIRNDNNADDGTSSSKTQEQRNSSEEGNYERISSEITDNFNSLSLEITKDKPAQIDRKEATSFTGLNEISSNDVAVRLKSILRVANRQDTIKKHVQLDSPVIYYESEASDECVDQDSALVEVTGTQNSLLLVEEQTNAVSHRFIEHHARLDFQDDQDKYADEDRMNNLPEDKTYSLSTSKLQNATPRSTRAESLTLSPKGSNVELSKLFLCNSQTVVSVQTQLKENSKQVSEGGFIHHSPLASTVEGAQSISCDHNETQDRSTKLLIHSVNQEIKNSQLFFELTDQECVSNSPTDLKESVEVYSEDCTQYSPADKCTTMLTKDRCETEYAIQNVINQETQLILGVQRQKYVEPCQPESKGNEELFSKEDCTQYSPADNFVGIESTTKSRSEMQGSFKISKKPFNASERNAKQPVYYGQNHDHQPEIEANVILTSEEDCTQCSNAHTKSTSHFTDTHSPAMVFRDGDAGEKQILMAHVTDTNLPAVVDPCDAGIQRGGNAGINNMSVDRTTDKCLPAVVESLRCGDADIKSISIDHITYNHLPAVFKPLRGTGAIKKRNRRVNMPHAAKRNCASNPALVSVMSKDLADEQANCSIPNMGTEAKSKGLLRKASLRVLKDNLRGKKLLEKQSIAAVGLSSNGILRKADNEAYNKPVAMENMETIDSLDFSLDLFTAYPAECNETQQEMDLFLSDVKITSNVSITGITHVRVKSPGEFMPMSDMPEGFWESKNSVAINDWFKNMELW